MAKLKMETSALPQTIHTFKVWIDYDPEVGRWYVCNSELYGLGLEDDHPGRLLDRLVDAAPDLIELNNEFEGSGQIFVLPVFKKGIEIERAEPKEENMEPGNAFVEIFREFGLTDEEHQTIFGGSGCRE